MSSTSATSPGSTPPSPRSTYAAVLDPPIKFLVIGTACSATLIPLLVVLFFFSNSSIRRQPVFILNVLMIALGLCEGAINIFNQTRSMLAEPVPVGFSIAFACLEVLVPMVADTVLLVRVTAVYPPCDMHFTYVAGIYVPLTAIKAARLTVESVFIAQWTGEIMFHAHDNVLIAAQMAWNNPYPKAAWALRLVDSTYASMLFLCRLKQRHRPKPSIPGLNNDTNCSKDCGRDPLKTLFWISTSNFVFPVILDVALLVIAFRDPSFLNGVYVLMVSNYVDIVGVLLATIWSTRNNRYPHAQPGLTMSGALSDFRTARGQGSSHFGGEELEGERNDSSIPMSVINVHLDTNPSESNTQV